MRIETVVGILVDDFKNRPASGHDNELAVDFFPDHYPQQRRDCDVSLQENVPLLCHTPLGLQLGNCECSECRGMIEFIGTQLIR